MSESRQQPDPKPGRPLSTRAIVIGGVLIGLVGAAAVVALLHFYGGGTERDKAGLDVVRTAGTLLVGTGGAIALLLTARRQRSTEQTLEHQRAVAAANERDVTEQRLTELYTRAVDQLGSERAPVRLGGLYALERLAQNNSDQRQTIVDVICAYLRMPYTPPEDPPPTADSAERSEDEKRRQELQVRLTAQGILGAHLKPKAADAFWAGINLDLSEAHLHRLDLTDCQMHNVLFSGARFSEDAWFNRAQFDDVTQFSRARFGEGAVFFGDARFNSVTFFDNVQFGRVAGFDDANFATIVMFTDARAKLARFNKAQFSGPVFFGGAEFHEVQLSGARARPDPARPHPHKPAHYWPAGWKTRDATEGEEEGWAYLIPDEDATE
jgi:uncharacterized protein YjbI with pentapeptide repeats